jgi:hypothetical protein
MSAQKNRQARGARCAIADSNADAGTPSSNKIDAGHEHEEESFRLLDVGADRREQREAVLSVKIFMDLQLDPSAPRVGEAHIEIKGALVDFKSRRLDDRFSEFVNAGAQGEAVGVHVDAGLPIDIDSPILPVSEDSDTLAIDRIIEDLRLERFKLGISIERGDQ